MNQTKGNRLVKMKRGCRCTAGLPAFLLAGVLLLTPSFAQESAGETLQSSMVTLQMRNVTLQKVLAQLKSRYGYEFFYSPNVLNVQQRVSVSANGQSVSSVLQQALKNSGCTFNVDGKKVYITKNLSSPQSDQRTPVRSTQRTVKGKMTHRLVGSVTDGSSEEPLIGVTVRVKGTQIATVTDVDGNFSLDVPSNSTVVFSYVGYKDKQQYITDQGVVSVKMQASNEMLSDVVVVGAGTQKKVSVTGAITSVKGSDLIAPTSSLTNNLAGKLAGVISSSTSGEPGSTSEFYIRGISTFGGRTAPLILLDGVEISSGDLNNLPAESIESFSILKDASATAIYGARGANGVMLITTKSGAENSKARINVTMEASVLKPVNVVEFADGPTYMKTYNEAQLSRTSTAIPRYSDQAIEYTRSGINPYVYPNVDWTDLMFKDYSYSQRGNINVSGGGSRVTYYMSLQANHDTGILNVPKAYSMDNNYNRYMYVFQNNIGYKLTSTTKMDLRMNAQISRTHSPNTSSSNIFQQIFLNNPVTFPAVYPRPEGSSHIYFGSAVMSTARFYTNPLANMLNTFRETNANKLNISLNIDQKLDFITKGLSLRGLINFNNWSQSYYTRSLTPFYYNVKEGSWSAENPSEYELNELQKGTDYISESGISRNSDNTFYFDARLNYDRRFGKHSVTGMLMYMMREYRSSVLPNRNQGFSGRATYDYDNRYMAEFNFGYNGTERLASGHRFEFFPAVSLGWVASNEKFWKPLEKYIDFLKIRGSYGLVGSDETGSSAGAPHFLYINDVNMSGGGSFASGYTGNYTLRGPVVTSYATEDAHWERAKEFDLGADIRLFNEFNITFDYFHNKRDRILMKRASFPQILGYASAVPWSNIGKVDSKGFELSINWTKHVNKDLSFDIRGNYTYNRNKYVYVDEPDYPFVWQVKTGHPLGMRIGYIADGLFEDQNDIDTHADQSLFGSTVMPGDIKYRDVNGDGKITSDDEVMISPYGSTPRIQYGFGASVNYKHLDVSVFFNGSAKRTIMLNGIYPFGANDSNDRNLMKWIADSHWTAGADNNNVVYPRLGVLTTQISNNMQPSTWWLRCGNFLRFKTLEIGYTFKLCRVYVNGDNIAVWSPFKYWDPELSYNTYPLSRTFNLGVQFKF